MTLHQVGSKLIYDVTLSGVRVVTPPISFIDRLIRKASDMLIQLMRKE